MSASGLPPAHSGKDRGWRTAQGEKLAPALNAAWEQSYSAPITADSDVAGAVDALMDRSIRTGALFERTAAMRVEQLGELEVLLAPNRRHPGPEGENHGGSCQCVFCSPPSPDARAVRWRDWDLLPNAFPYARLHSQHLLAVAATHVEQSFAPRILEDMIDLQGALDRKSRTFHYNGWAGNSQPHLHWQITKERFPVEKAIESSSTTLRRTQEGALSTFDDGALAGIVVEGDKAYVVRTVSEIIKQLESDPIAKDRYNLLLLPGDRVRCVVIPRRADALAVDVGDGPDKLSVVEVSGRLIATSDALPAGVTADAYRAGLKQTIVRPHELPWLKAIAGQASHLALRVRTWQSQPSA